MFDPVSVLQIFAVLITLKTGIYPILRPDDIFRTTGIEASSPRATTEIRAVLGGIFTGMGLTALIFSRPEIYKSLAIVYTVNVIVRGVSILVDRSMERSNFYTLSSDAACANLLFL